MANKKSDMIKNVLINLGVLLILIGSTAIKGDITFFLIALMLLAIQTFEFTAIAPKKLVIAEIMLAVTVAVGSITQLVNASAARTQQVFLVVLLLGSLLIVVEAVRKYADME